MPLSESALAKGVGYYVKDTLRKYVADTLKNSPYRENYRPWGGLDVLLWDELPDDQTGQSAAKIEVPASRPLLTVREGPCVLQEFALRTVHNFSLDLRIATDAQSGAATNGKDVPSGDLLSDDVSKILRARDARDELALLGIEELTLGGKRQETGRGGVRLDIVTVTCAARENIAAPVLVL